MKKHLFICFCLLLFQTGFAQQFPTFDWARVASEGYPTIPSVGTNYSSDIRLIKRDAAGNLYVSGQINKAMKFANTDIYSQDYFGNNFGYYLMKLNPTGETITWVKTLMYADITNFELDADGFIYVESMGSGGGTLKYGDATAAGGTTYPNVNGDALLFKINAGNGNLVWIKKPNSSGVGGANYPFIQTDNTAIYATDVLGPNANNSTTNRGYRVFKATKAGIDADPSLYINNKVWVLDKDWFAANVDPLFENHIFDMKLTHNKQSLWVYLKTGDVWIDDFSNQQFDTTEMIVIRLDNLNAAIPTVGFMRRFPSLHCPDKGQLEIDSQGNVLLTGFFGVSPTYNSPIVNGNGTVTFAGTTYEFPMNSQKQFIAKFSPTGAETWIKFYDIQIPYQFRSLTLDANDNMYVANGSYPTMQTIGSFTSINDPWWVMKLKPNGDQVYMWSNEEGGSNNSDPVLCGNGDGVLIGTNGGGGKYGTKEIVRYSSFVLSNLKHSGTTKPFEELKRLKNINTGQDVLSYYSSHPTKFTELGGNLVFFAWGGAALGSDCYLWKTDGTENGTTSLTAMYKGDPTPTQPYSGETLKTPTHLYFEGQSRNSTTNNFQQDIWKSDGTVAGTVKIKSFDMGTTTMPSGNANGLTPYDIRDIKFSNDLVFFTMADATNSKIDLWKTDGTEAGTVRLYEGCQSQISSFNNYIYYFIKGIPDPNFGSVQYTLRRHNGTSGGFVKNLASTAAANIPRFFGVVNNQLLFVADGTIVLNGNNVNSGMELWKTDGTGAGTVIVKDINPEVSNNFPPGPFSSGKSSITYANQDNSLNGIIKEPALYNRSIIHNNILYFGADDGINGRELWKSDGTEAGTVLIKDLIPGTYTDIWGQTYPSGSDPYSFFVFQNNLVFTSWAPGSENIALYKSDGTNAGTSILKNYVRHGISYNYSVPVSYAVLNNNLYFSGKEQPNSLIHPTYNEPFTGNFNELWVSDGTPDGTKQLKNLVKGWQAFNPMNLYSWSGSLYFSMYGAIAPNIFVTPTESEPWKFTPAPCTNPAPAGPLATAPTILASYPATIKANGCLGIVKWYAAASGGSPIFTGDNYTTPLLNTTTTYYLTCTFNNCESQRSPATVTVNQPNCTTLPSPPTCNGGSVVNGNSITLTALGCTEQTRWYNQPTGGSLLGQNNTFTTPNLTTPTTYYPVCFVQGCESARTLAVGITITPSSGQALDFDGVDDVVTVPENVGFNAQNFTMEAWARFDANNRSQQIMDNSQRFMGFYYSQSGSSINIGFIDNTGNERKAGFSFTPTVGTWYHFAGSFNNSTKEMYFYINGELQDIQIINYTPNQSTLGVKLGINYGTNDSYLDGRMEEVRFWNVARTETQIGASYNTELSGNESGLVFYYKFDGEATCDVQDCSPNQLHGTRNGTTGTNNKPQFVNTSVALTDVACGVSSACTLLNPCPTSLPIASPNYTTETLIRQANAVNGGISATNQITNTAKITYEARSVTLHAGFAAQPANTGYFKAQAGGCN
ncbi:LamG-like jellyroll fold domain-containing protein [Runella sp.]|uniref:Ig-like domain-containing protein n=1 Tax=Runella sp. TaxID=1960881 RepID=UPI003D0E3B94